MTALWTWITQSTPVSETHVGWSDASNPIEVSAIDTQVVNAYGNDPDVIIILRRNRDTREEFVLLDRQPEGGLFSEWLGSALGAPTETATVATVGGPVATGAVPVISPPNVGAPATISGTVESPPIVAQPKAEPPSGPPYLIAGLVIAAVAAGIWWGSR